jgi:hypothetical protein
VDPGRVHEARTCRLCREGKARATIEGMWGG